MFFSFSSEFNFLNPDSNIEANLISFNTSNGKYFISILRFLALKNILGNEIKGSQESYTGVAP